MSPHLCFLNLTTLFIFVFIQSPVFATNREPSEFEKLIASDPASLRYLGKRATESCSDCGNDSGCEEDPVEPEIGNPPSVIDPPSSGGGSSDGDDGELWPGVPEDEILWEGTGSYITLNINLGKAPLKDRPNRLSPFADIGSKIEPPRRIFPAVHPVPISYLYNFTRPTNLQPVTVFLGQRRIGRGPQNQRDWVGEEIFKPSSLAVPKILDVLDRTYSNGRRRITVIGGTVDALPLALDRQFGGEFLPEEGMVLRFYRGGSVPGVDEQGNPTNPNTGPGSDHRNSVKEVVIWRNEGELNRCHVYFRMKTGNANARKVYYRYDLLPQSRTLSTFAGLRGDSGLFETPNNVNLVPPIEVECLTPCPGYEHTPAICRTRKSRPDAPTDDLNGNLDDSSPIYTTSRVIEQYEIRGNRRFLVATREIVEEGDSSRDRVTRMEYFTDEAGRDISGRPCWRKNADGTWTIWKYNFTPTARITEVITPYRDGGGVHLADDGSNMDQVASTAHRIVRKIIVTAQTQEEVTTIYAPDPKVVSHSVEELKVGSAGETVTETRRYLHGGATGEYLQSTIAHLPYNQSSHAGRIAWRINEDGMASTYIYEQEDVDRTKVTMISGVALTPASGVRPTVEGRQKTVSIYNEAWKKVEERIYDLKGANEADRAEEEVLLDWWHVTDTDCYGRPTRKVFFGRDGESANGETLPSDVETIKYGCCGPVETIDRSGAQTTNHYDFNKRLRLQYDQRSSGGDSVLTRYHYSYLDPQYVSSPLITTTIRQASGKTIFGGESWTNQGIPSRPGNLSTTISYGPDTDDDVNPLQGDLGMPETSIYSLPKFEKNPERTITQTLTLPDGGRETTTTYPDQTMTISITYPDGRMKTSQDQEGNVTTYEYGIHSEGGGGTWTKVIQPNETQWTKTYEDKLGRTIKTENADGSVSTMLYYPTQAPPGFRGKPLYSEDEDGVGTTYAYSLDGSEQIVIRSLPGGQTTSSRTETNVLSEVTLRGIKIQPAIRSASYTNGVLVSESFSRPDGYASGTRSFGRETVSVKTIPVDGSWTVTAVSAEGLISREYYRDGLLAASLTFDVEADAIPEDQDDPEADPSDDIPTDPPVDFSEDIPHLLYGTITTYDPFGRVLTQTDARTGTMSYDVDGDGFADLTDSGNLLAMKDAGGRITRYSYDVMGRRRTVDAPDTQVLDPVSNQLVTNDNQTHTSYTNRGQIKATWGAGVYPRAYQYDELGRQTHLHTWQTLPTGEPTIPGEAITQWIFDPQRGWLVEKNYHGETDNGTADADYEYTAAGRLKKRTWERGVSTIYTYDQGLLTKVGYSDNTPDIDYTYDSYGRIAEVHRAGQLHATYHFDADNLLLVEEHLNLDTPAPRYLVRRYDNLLRFRGYDLATNADDPDLEPEEEVYYSYDDWSGRLSIASTAHTTATSYVYEPLSHGLIRKTIGYSHNVENTWDSTRDVLLSKENKAPTGTISKYTYEVNEIGQRVSVSQSGSAFSGSPDIGWAYNSRGELVKADHFSDATDRAYSYDAIGNRLESVRGTTALTGSANYAVNAQNQYSSTPSFNAHPTYGNEIRYDADGNATDIPLPTTAGVNVHLTWDAENRLIEYQPPYGPSTAYTYDYLGRRISKTISDGSGNFESTWYLYDGWNLAAEYDAAGELEKTYLWGLDLSGSMQGAGGVGGLLAVVDHTIDNGLSSAQHYPTYDGNGNVSEYLHGSSSVAAHFEYDPFGNITSSTGSQANQFDIRFSTKKQDAETGLSYYGYRYYDPVTGRWPSRDPIEEQGGINLYGFVGNDGINFLDFLGAKKVKRLFVIRGPGNSTGVSKSVNNPIFSSISYEYPEAVKHNKDFDLLTNHNDSTITKATLKAMIVKEKKKWEEANGPCPCPLLHKLIQGNNAKPMTPGRLGELLNSDNIDDKNDTIVIGAHCSTSAKTGNAGLVLSVGKTQLSEGSNTRVNWIGGIPTSKVFKYVSKKRKVILRTCYHKNQPTRSGLVDIELNGRAEDVTLHNDFSKDIVRPWVNKSCSGQSE